MEKWRTVLNNIWFTNRVHVSEETTKAYESMKQCYGGEILKFKTGETCNYWEVPPGWKVHSAKLIGPHGNEIVSYEKNPLCLFTYSPSFEGVVSLKELDDHIFSIPKFPERTPFHFRNQYRFRNPQWGFCIPHSLRKKLKEGFYTVEIKTEFFPYHMDMLEVSHEGENKDSVLFIGHFDHPFMCNDGLVGCLAGHEIVKRLSEKKTKLTYRMLSTIEIIGSVFYANKYVVDRKIKEALFVASSGAEASLSFQTSFSGNSTIDRVFTHVLKHTHPAVNVYPFRKGGLGNDEIAFDVQGINIPCSSVMRAPFDQYHTDNDNPEHVNVKNFEEMIELIQDTIEILEENATLTANFKGLPCLSHDQLDLYLPPPTFSHVEDKTRSKSNDLIDKLPDRYKKNLIKKGENFNELMTLFSIMCDGKNTILDIAEKVDLPFKTVHCYAKMWEKAHLLELNWVHPFDKKKIN